MTEKEIGMGKLMKYVEEMQKEGINICRPQFQEYYLVEMTLISKYYGLIKWLVDNDKIDRHSKDLELDMKRIRIPQDYYISGGQSLDLQHKKAKYLDLIALLAIQDEPIEYLISLLKNV